MTKVNDQIEEIERDVEDVQKKILSMSAPKERFTDEQIIMLESARNALGMFQRFEMAQLKKAFNVGGS